MSARVVTAGAVLLALVVVTVVLARRLGGAPVSRRAVELLFPASQAVVLVFLFYFLLAYDLPAWLFALTAAVGILCGPCDLALFKALRTAEEKELAEERVRLLENQVALQRAHFESLEADADKAKSIRRDVAAELRAADELLDAHEVEHASSCLMHAVDLMDSSVRRFCENSVVDALVTMKAKACDESGVETSFELEVPRDLSLSSVELCAVFSNMLDNALQACSQVPAGARRIELRARIANEIGRAHV